MSESTLKDRMSRAIAAVIHRSLGDGGEVPKHAVMGDRRKVAEHAAEAALATIQLNDTIGDCLIVVRKTAVMHVEIDSIDADERVRGQGPT